MEGPLLLLAPHPKALLPEQPLEPSCGSGWGLSGGGSTGEGDTLHPAVPRGWELPGPCSLRISRPYRGAWRSSGAILSRVTRRPPGTWGSWRTRGAHGSISTLITLEEVHTDMVRRSSVGKGWSQGVHNTCTASLGHSTLVSAVPGKFNCTFRLFDFQLSQLQLGKMKVSQFMPFGSGSSTRIVLDSEI